MSDNSLHITVTAAPQSTAGNPRIIDHDLRMTKASILYADKVKLCSLSAPLVNKFFNVSYRPANEVEKTEALLTMINLMKSMGFDLETSIIEQEAPRYLRLLKRNPILLTKKESTILSGFKKTINNSWEPFRDFVINHTKSIGLEELEIATGAGLLEIQDFSGVGDIYGYFSSVEKTLGSSDTHPMLDEQTNNLVKQALLEGKLEIKTLMNRRAKQTAMVANLFDRLPVFDIGMDEILDLRNELQNPLKRFRAEIADLTKNIETAAWDEDLPHDIQDIYRSKIEPALLEIEEKLKSAGFRDFWSRRLGEKSGTLIPGLTAAFTVGAAISPFAGLLLAFMTLAVVSESGFAEWRERLNEVEKNGLYFYYKVRNRNENK